MTTWLVTTLTAGTLGTRDLTDRGLRRYIADLTEAAARGLVPDSDEVIIRKAAYPGTSVEDAWDDAEDRALAARASFCVIRGELA